MGGAPIEGLGGFKIDKITQTNLNLNETADLLTFLAEDEPWKQEEKKDTKWLPKQVAEVQKEVIKSWADIQSEIKVVGSDSELMIARSWLQIEVQLKGTGPFLVNDPLAQIQTGFDHAPLADHLFLPKSEPDEKTPPVPPEAKPDEKPSPVLPGSGLRGALRSHAERLARTIATHQAHHKGEAAETHFKAHCPACDPNARRKRELGSEGEPLESCDSLLLAGEMKQNNVEALSGNLEVKTKQLCLACQLFGSGRRGSRLRIGDAKLVGEPVYKAQDFLAVDRFTGGGADGFKFDAVALWQPTFQATLFLENPAPWELGWLLLTLRDLQDGFIPLGFGAAKGYGQVEVKQWTVSLGYLTEDDLPQEKEKEQEEETGAEKEEKDLFQPLLEKITPQPSGLYQVVTESWSPDQPPETWLAVAKNWVTAFHSTQKGLVRSDTKQDILPLLEKDTYFGQHNLTTLYPVEVKRNGS